MSDTKDMLRLLAQADAHYRALEKLLPLLRADQHGRPADSRFLFLLQDVRLHRAVLYVLRSERAPKRARPKRLNAKPRAARFTSGEKQT